MTNRKKSTCWIVMNVDTKEVSHIFADKVTALSWAYERVDDQNNGMLLFKSEIWISFCPAEVEEIETT